MQYFDPFAHLFWQTAAPAVACGGIIGLERQSRRKVAGVRRSIPICLSAALGVQLGASVAALRADPTRGLGQVVTGAGFLGAGVILTRDGVVRGVTTAAVIWMLAAIGATIGLGCLQAAVAVAAVTVTLLTGIDLLGGRLQALTRAAYARDRADGAR